MKYFSVLAIIFAISVNSYSQAQKGLLLQINAYTNEVLYYHDGVLTQTPSVKEGDNIYVVISEFNPYQMEASLDVKAVNYSQKSDALLGGVMGEGSSFSGIGQLFGGLNAGSGIKEALMNIPGSRGGFAADAGVAEAKSEFLELTAEMEKIEAKLAGSTRKLEMFNNTVLSRKLAMEDLEKLKQNKLIKPSRIKELAMEEIMHAFAKAEGEKITTEDLLSQVVKKGEIKESINAYNAALQEYSELAKKWDRFGAKLGNITFNREDDQFEFIRTKTDSLNLALKSEGSKLSAPPLETKFLEQYFSESAQTMAYLRRIYEEIQGDVFKHSFPPVQAGNDAVLLTTSVYAKDDSGKMKLSKTYEQTIPVVSGWKVSGSLGLSFGKMAKKTFEYNIVNDAIVQDELDDFFPSIVSFAHISRKSLKNIQLGGSFGIGFPLQKGGGLESLAFFGGPTLFLGKKQKFLISAGLMGAKVQRLSAGFRPGDAFDGSVNILPVRSLYELGYFIGISYDIIN